MLCAQGHTERRVGATTVVELRGELDLLAAAPLSARLDELTTGPHPDLVLDLRGNGGGLLREAVNIVNLFVPKNELVVETKGRIAEWDKTYRTLSEPLDAAIPLVVLVDAQTGAVVTRLSLGADGSGQRTVKAA